MKYLQKIKLLECTYFQKNKTNIKKFEAHNVKYKDFVILPRSNRNPQD